MASDRDYRGSALSTETKQEERCELRTAQHVFGNSPHMLALCLTVIGLIKIYAKLHNVSTFADELLAACAMAFLAACIASYISIRSVTNRRRLRAERIADLLFIGALGLAAVVALVITVQMEG